MKVSKRVADVSWLAFSHDSAALRACAVDKLTCQPCGSLWDAGTGHERPWPPSGIDEGACPVEHPSGQWLFARGEKGGLAAHHLASGRTVVETFKGRIAHVAVTSDGGTILFCWVRWPPPTRHSYESRTWSEATRFGPGFVADLFPGIDDGSLSVSHCLVPLPDSKRFVTIESRMFEPPRLAVRAVADGSVLAATTDATIAADAAALAIAPDGERIVVASGRALLVFSTTDVAAPPQKIANDGKKHFTGVAFHPTGKFLAATSNDETVKLFDASSWDVVKTFTWKIGRMRSVALSPDGALAAAGSDKGGVVVWDLDL